MQVEEMVIEGFKTYQSRTVIDGFDPQFNAITGENGSGKSNILDAIQFLLGSNSKDMLRFKSNIYELIYKEGHAGIVQASVSITFLVTKKELRQTLQQHLKDGDRLVVTRQITRQKQKFFINGLTSKLGKVKQLFQSVQLNIDNPHFLIKQGQITHIAKMKPAQILAMIEETAGTSYYNQTKHASEALIRRKDEKLKAINDLLKTTIEPHLARERADRDNYLIYKKGQFQLQKIKRQIRLHDCVFKQKKLTDTRRLLTDWGSDRQGKQHQLELQSAQLQELERQITQVRKQNEALGAVSQDRASVRMDETAMQIRNLTARNQKQGGQVMRKGQSLFSIQQQLRAVEMRLKFAGQQLANAQRQEQYLGSLGGSEAQSRRAKQAHLARSVGQCEQRLANMRTKRQYLIRQRDRQKQMAGRYEAQLKSSKREYQDCTGKLRDLEADPVPKPQTLYGQSDDIIQEQRRLQGQLEALYSRNFKLKMLYKPPTIPGFDSRKVYGKAMMLFRVHQKAHLKALQIGAGGKLNNIIVQDEITSAALLEGRAFSYAVSILPQRKMQPQSLPERVLTAAKELAASSRGFVQVAVRLIEFQNRVQNSMHSIFGGWLVCSSQQLARKIAFNPNVALRAKCVTFEGEVIDPRGTMAGGYRQAAQFLLNLCEQVQGVKKQLARLQQQRGKQELTSRANRQKQEAYLKYQYQVQGLKAKCQRLKQSIAKGAPNRKDLAGLQVQLQAIEQQIKGEQSNLRDYKAGANAQQAKQLATAKRLRHMKEVSKLERDKDQLSKDCAKIVAYLQNLKREIGRGQENIQILKDQLQQLAKQKQREVKRAAQLGRKKKSFADAERQLAQLIVKGKQKTEQLKAQLKNRQSDFQRAKKQLNGLQNELIELGKDKQLMEQKNRLSEQQRLAIALMNVESDRHKADQLQRQQQILRKKVNLNVEANQGRLEQQFTDLIAKRRTLQQDRRLLLGNIEELDEKRKETLEGCYLKVRDNLANIFSDLLPGATARLILVDQGDVTAGCQLAVQLSGVRKHLGELSGGQRSLLALSFLLALLLYRPAPFYILDQIDSALDLSHTQNIGQMIRNRFGQSQFLLISLKEGMYSSARVLYRVSFIDGESKVERQALKKKGKV